MKGTNQIQINLLCDRVGGKAVINQLVDGFYDKMLDDYRVSRYFNDHEKGEQTNALKSFLIAAFGGSDDASVDVKKLLDDYFLTSFARDKRESFVSESDFGFFGMIISQDTPSKKQLCDAHSHLLKFMPDDSHYDVVMEHLTSTLQELNIDKNTAADVIALAESARNSVLGS